MTITSRAATTLALTVTAALALTSCSSSGTTTDGADGEITGTVTVIYDSTYKAAVDPIVEDFEAKYPGTTVEVNYQGGDLGPVVLSQLQGGTAPDVLLSYPAGVADVAANQVIPLAAGGLISPIEPTWKDDIPELWRSQVEYEDQLFAFPGAVQPLTAIYNQTFLDELGLTAPATLDDVLPFCADAQSKGVYAYAQGLGEVASGPQMLAFAQVASLIYGPTPDFDDQLADGDATYTDSGWQDQFQIYQDMFDAGCFGEGALGRSRVQGQEAVSARQALGVVDVGAVLSGITTGNADDEFVVTAMPAANDGDSFGTALPGYVLTVNAKAKNPAAARAFVEFAGEPAESAKYATGFASVPLIPNTDFEPSSALVGFAQLVNDGKVAKLTNITPEVQAALNQGVQSMLLGNDTPASVAQKMQDAYDQ